MRNTHDLLSAQLATTPTALAPPSGPEALRPLRRILLPAALGLFVLFLLVTLLRQADGHRVRGLLAQAGPRLLWILPAFLASMVAATAAWALALRALGQRARAGLLFRLRAAAEAVVLSVPGGAVLSDLLRPRWLASRSAVPLAEAAASVAVGRALIVLADGVYVGLAVALGHATLAQIFAGLGLGPRGWWLQAALALGLAAAGAILLAALVDGRLARSLARLLSRLPSTRLRRRIAGSETAPRIDALLHGLSAPPQRRALGLSLAASVAQWLCETVETYLLLRLLGVEASFSMALAIESMVAAVRAAAFFVPAGLGAQDVTLAIVLRALGLAQAIEVAVAFVLVKRTREVLWIALGYGFALTGRTAR